MGAGKDDGEAGAAPAKTAYSEFSSEETSASDEVPVSLNGSAGMTLLLHTEVRDHSRVG
jgi:hypothetical protein